MPLPVIGQIATRGKTSEQMASEVATALKKQLGLASVPDASIEIVSYPPIFVVGDVATPGSFEFRPGMTVLQALASGGGQRRVATDNAAERFRLVSDLRLADDGLVRGRARIARLKAELSGAKSIAFPTEVTGNADAALAQAAMDEEQTIFAARAREFDRQGESLTELSKLLELEIDTLKTRLTDVEQMITSSETELNGVQSLVQKGVVTVSRRSELERQVADFRFDRLNQTTAILRAQQELSQANREAAQLTDARQTQDALDLQDAQAKLEQLLLQQATSQRLLVNIDGESLAGGNSSRLSYAIVRQGESGPVELPADETTSLLPGDVLKVSAGATRAVPHPDATSATAVEAAPVLASRSTADGADR